jgi:two-component system chemotaxis response regulator CheB
MRQAGARTLGQDEHTSVVYGMPRAAHEIGAVERQLPLHRLTPAILDACAAAAQSPVSRTA